MDSQELEQAWEMSENDLYQCLGVSAMGNDSVAGAVKSLGTLQGFATNSNGHAALLGLNDTLVEKGKAAFQSAWAKLEPIVCKIHNDHTPVGNAKDLASYIMGH